MFIGHFAVGLAAKRLTPQVSLGVLVAAPLLLDLLWPVFLSFGLETVRIEPGITQVTPLDLHDYPYSHSLLMAIVWSVLFGAVVGHLKQSVRVALVGGALVFSHWLLDFVTHRPDMPLYPGSDTYVGLGLWHSLVGTLLVEVSLFIAGVAVYVKVTHAKNKVGGRGFWALIAALLALYLAAIFGPPPPDVGSLIIGGYAILALVGWAYWVDRNRSALSPKLAR
jgi:membrane-bound metal-dependent hydrolase YbcI (DUF457 family)